MPATAPKLIAAPKLTVVDEQLVIEWPDGPRPALMVITTAGYQALIKEINFQRRMLTMELKLVAAARRVVASLPTQGVALRTDDDHPASAAGVGTSMSGTSPE